jgi:para-nitrobenzyl esterase
MNDDVQGTSPDYRKLRKEAFGASAEKIARKYPLNRYKSPSIAWATVLTDRMWARATREQHTLIAERAPVYGYEFADRDAPMFLPLEADFDWGVARSGDPNGHGLPSWRRFSSGDTLSLAPGAVRPIDYAAEHELAF